MQDLANNPYVLTARVRLKPEHFTKARDAVLGILPQTRAEEGCHLFNVHEATDEENTLVFYEIFKDRAALDRHYAQPYTAAVFEAYADWLASPVETQPLKALSVCSS